MKFDEEFLAFEAEFAYFRPGECVNFCGVLKDEYAHVGDRQVKVHALVVLEKKKHITHQENTQQLLIHTSLHTAGSLENTSGH